MCEDRRGHNFKQLAQLSIPPDLSLSLSLTSQTPSSIAARLAAPLGLLPEPLANALAAAARFLAACCALLPQFVAPPLPEALRRAGLVLAASLVMVVVVSSVDSAWLYLYLLRARRLAA